MSRLNSSRLDATGPSACAAAPRQRTQAPPERRQRRSGDPAVALGLLLDAARRAHGYSALAVADTSGLLVAGSGHFGACEELAANAPLLRKPPTKQGARQEVDTLSIDGIEVLVIGAGAASSGLDGVARGCARILGRTEPQRPLAL